MTHCVLDASMALAWVLSDSVTTASEQVLTDISAQGAIVPVIWPLEVANVLVRAERRKRITHVERIQALAELDQLSVRIEPLHVGRTWTDVVALADLYALSIYDASYLETAVRLLLPLASLDDALRDAAKACGLDVLG